MNTKVTMTIEKVESGYRVKINHDGNQLEHPAIDVVGAALCEYWKTIEKQEHTEEDLRFMKAKRKDMKKFINNSVDWLDRCRGEGMLRDVAFEDDIPF